jgi:hypothetical protein
VQITLCDKSQGGGILHSLHPPSEPSVVESAIPTTTSSTRCAREAYISDTRRNPLSDAHSDALAYARARLSRFSGTS